MIAYSEMNIKALYRYEKNPRKTILLLLYSVHNRILNVNILLFSLFPIYLNNNNSNKSVRHKFFCFSKQKNCNNHYEQSCQVSKEMIVVEKELKIQHYKKIPLVNFLWMVKNLREKNVLKKCGNPKYEDRIFCCTTEGNYNFVLKLA